MRGTTIAFGTRRTAIPLGTCGTAVTLGTRRAAIAFGLDGLAFTDHGRLVPEARLRELNRQYAPFRVFGWDICKSTTDQTRDRKGVALRELTATESHQAESEFAFGTATHGAPTKNPALTERPARMRRSSSALCLPKPIRPAALRA